jgi:hypothetical protein
MDSAEEDGLILMGRMRHTRTSINHIQTDKETGMEQQEGTTN